MRSQTDTVLILNDFKIRQKIDRMSIEVLERNYDSKEIVLAGISKSGVKLAEIIAGKIKTVSDTRIEIIEISINKAEPTEHIGISCDQESLKNKNIIIVDDVLNTGRTMLYAMKPFLDIPLKKLQALVLVHRNHNNFPVLPDFIGLTLSTTLQEHIEVDLDSKKLGIYLS
jgi:pyrimidine operon attenuation protein / uracil phosphoribosyltransferase